MSGWEVSAWLSGVLVWDRLTREGMVLPDVTTLSHPYVVVGEAPHSWVEPPWGCSWRCRPECSRTGQWCGTSWRTPAAPSTRCSGSVPTQRGSCPSLCKHTHTHMLHKFQVQETIFSIKLNLKLFTQSLVTSFTPGFTALTDTVQVTNL